MRNERKKISGTMIKSGLNGKKNKNNLMIMSALNLLNSCNIVVVLSQFLLIKQAVVPVTQLLIPVKDRDKTAFRRQ